LRCRGGCLGVDAEGFSAVVAVVAAVAAAAAVAVPLLSNVFRWASLRSQVGWKE